MPTSLSLISKKITSFFAKQEYPETGYSDERYTDPKFLNELIESGGLDYCLVDSRDAHDYEKGNIKSSINVPYYNIEGNLPSENLFTIIIVYGYTKRSSIKAAEVLSELGYFNVVAFGAYSKWTNIFGK